MLYRRGRDGGVINELAKNTKIDLKKRTMQVDIDTSCHWSDGRPITVYDIQEGIHRLFTEEEPTILSLYLKNGIDINNGDKELSDLGLRILNDTTLEFDLVVTPLVLQHMLAFNAATPAPIHLGTKWPGDGSSMVRIGSGPFVAVSHIEKIIYFEYNDYDRVIVEGRLDKPYIERLTQAQKIMADKGYGPNNTLKLSFGLRHSTPYEQLGFAIRGMLNQSYIEAKTDIVKHQPTRVLNDLSLNAWGTGMSDPIATLSGLAVALTQMGNKDFKQTLHHAALTDITSTRNETLHQLEQELIDMKIFHPLYEVLSPTVIAKNIKLGAGFYETGRNMIFDDCD